MWNYAEIVEQSKAHTLVSWSAQGAWTPIPYERAEGVYVWDMNGKRYLDWSSQLVNVNIGHSHPHVIQAIQEQVAKLTYVEPSGTTEPRARLGALLAEITPGTLTKTLFSNGGTDGIENAMKAARLFTGRPKILTRYRSYHGGTFGAATAGGDPRRLANEPGIPGIVRFPDPYSYRSPAYRGRTQEEGDLVIADMIEEIIQMEGPEYCAAILLEGYSGSSGVMQPSATFWTRIGELCRKYGILLIADEVMSGFGRTGEWFGINHYPDVTPDILVFAKGITSGYIPLGGTILSAKIAEYFDKNTLWAGLTYSAHALACAAGVANIEVYQSENLISRSAAMGKVLRQKLTDLAEKHPCVGEIRGTGLHQVLEIVKDRHSREPMSEYNKPLSDPMKTVAAALKANGLSTLVRWNMIFNCPPLIISEAQIDEGIAILDAALSQIDSYYTGKT
ncbi:MAG TPA: aminotransferase class III-fold pyridoxal phosphate-dependent enzyme [Aggregatilineales bacterium]|nr:aminotransferase class III-fold pyridoxal phosphate-dependent enzyme [Anaerolineales bacterium]HRE47120.1 aminotransferase class III-fold pyridoxal phosphate-dependent enzyme [Aggregatilineales bacterium]